MAAYLHSSLPVGSPDIAMLCRACAAIIWTTTEEQANSDCSELLTAAAGGQGCSIMIIWWVITYLNSVADKTLRVLTLLKEIAVEISLSGYKIKKCYNTAVVLKYKSLVIAFSVVIICSVEQVHSHLTASRQNGPIPQTQCEGFISCLSVLRECLDCLASWCTCNVSIYLDTEDKPISLAVDDREIHEPALTASDIIRTESAPEMIELLRYLCGFSHFYVASVPISSLSLTMLFSAKILPLILDIGHIYNNVLVCPQETTSAFMSSVLSLSSECGNIIATILLTLSRPLTSSYFIRESSNCHSTEAGVVLSKLCVFSVNIIAAVVSAWESVLRTPLISFVMTITNQEEISLNMLLRSIRSHLLENQYSPMLWTEKFTDSSGYSFGLPSPFLISLVEFTIFLCEKQHVRND